MNKKELAKLLFQTTEIKELFESQQFDTAIINKVIAQEIMREQEDEESPSYSNPESPEAQAEMVTKMEQEVNSLNMELGEFNIRLKEIRDEIKTARADRDREAARELAVEKQQVLRDIGSLEDKIASLKEKITVAAGKAAPTTSLKDDEQVIKIAQAVKSVLDGAEDNLSRAGEVPDAISTVTTATSNSIDNASAEVDKVVAASDAAPTTAPEPEPEVATEPAPEIDGSKGWANAKSAARARIKPTTTLEQIQASLQSPEEFKAFWGVRDNPEGKMEQAQKLFDEGYFEKRIEQLKKASEDPSNTEEVVKAASELAATTVSFDQYLSELPDGYELPLTNNATEILSFLPTTEIPTSPDEFETKFLDPIKTAVEEISPDPTDTAPEAAEDEEEAEETADVTAETEEVIENTPEADAEADGERPPPPQAEFDQKNLDLLKTFFGDNPQKSGFMKQFLLKNQAKMLVEMIDALNQIIAGQPSAGEDGEEERALTDDEPDATTRSTENPEGDADEVEEDDTEYIEEQLVNEIFSKLFKNKDEEVEISSNGTKFMRQDLEAMVDLLRSLKKDIGKYESYATRKSVNPSFNGSSLKEAMDAKLKVVQDAIAHLIKVIDNEIKNQREEAGNEEPVDESLNSILGENKSERKMKIEKVKEVYNEMRRMYEKGLKVSLENNEFEESKRGAEEIKDYVLSQKEFMGYFPRNVITSGGQVMTLGAAHKAMIEITGKFIETIRDVVTITRTQRVSFPNLVQATEDLIDISIAIESMFNIPSQIKGEIVDEFEEFQAEDEDNVSLSDEPTIPSGEGGDSDADAIDKEIEASEEELYKSGFMARPSVVTAVEKHFGKKGRFGTDSQKFAQLWQVIVNKLSEELGFAINSVMMDPDPEVGGEDLSENTWKGTNVDKYIRKISFNGQRVNAADLEFLKDKLEPLIKNAGEKISDTFIWSNEFPKFKAKIEAKGMTYTDFAKAVKVAFEERLASGLNLKFGGGEGYNETVGKILRALEKDANFMTKARKSTFPFWKDLSDEIEAQTMDYLEKESDIKDLFAADKPESTEDEGGDVVDTPKDGDTGESPETKDDAETDVEGGEEKSDVPETDGEEERDPEPTEYDKAVNVATKIANLEFVRERENILRPRFEKVFDGMFGYPGTLMFGLYANEMIDKGISDTDDIDDLSPNANKQFVKKTFSNWLRYAKSPEAEEFFDGDWGELRDRLEFNSDEELPKLEKIFDGNTVKRLLTGALMEWYSRDLEEALKPIINRMLKEHYNR